MDDYINDLKYKYSITKPPPNESGCMDKFIFLLYNGVGQSN